MARSLSRAQAATLDYSFTIAANAASVAEPSPIVSTGAGQSPADTVSPPFLSAGTSPLPTDARANNQSRIWASAVIVLVRRLFSGNRTNVFAGLAVAGGVIVVVAGSAYIAWLYLLPGLWSWAAGNGWFMAIATFLSLFIIVLPVYVYMMLSLLAEQFADLKISQVKVTSIDLQAIEVETIERLSGKPIGELLTLVRYSRAQLDAYYAMGLQQTRGSFRNALIAMWLGFAILLLGISSYVVPLQLAWLKAPTGDFMVIVLASAVIIEIIAALFLWIYRSTVGQLTYYYQLQMRSHSAIQSFSIASTMTSSDEAKRAVIDSALTAGLAPERFDLPTAKTLIELIKKQS